MPENPANAIDFQESLAYEVDETSLPGISMSETSLEISSLFWLDAFPHSAPR